MKKKPAWLKRLVVLTAILGLYPAFVLGFTWTHVSRSDLEGGRHGPLDAYRHALASAVVSYTLGEWAVQLVTRLFEAKGKDTNRMDRHNNGIGGRIGRECDSFGEIEPTVRQRVLAGAVDSPDPDQITWFPPPRWRNARLW